jgi:hypothetical protein
VKKGNVTIADEDLGMRSNKVVIESRQQFIRMRASTGAYNRPNVGVPKSRMDFFTSHPNRVLNCSIWWQTFEKGLYWEAQILQIGFCTGEWGGKVIV